MRVIYTSKEMSKKVWGARYTLSARYLLNNTTTFTFNIFYTTTQYISNTQLFSIEKILFVAFNKDNK
jgi:hypothetical protein